MRRALHIGLFIGTLLGMSACAAMQPGQGAGQEFMASGAKVP